jgi:methylmalonyl-CoA/ethylmalonyl-CoA epimerase
MNFHHIGVACKDINKELDSVKFLGYQLAGDFFSDPIQGVRGCFLNGPGPTLELLEDLPGSSTIKPWIDKGIKMYHLAFEATDLNSSIDSFKRNGALLVSVPKPSVAFDGREICFLMLKTRQLIELIEK